MSNNDFCFNQPCHRLAESHSNLDRISVGWICGGGAYNDGWRNAVISAAQGNGGGVGIPGSILGHIGRNPGNDSSLTDRSQVKGVGCSRPAEIREAGVGQADVSRVKTGYCFQESSLIRKGGYPGRFCCCSAQDNGWTGPINGNDGSVGLGIAISSRIRDRIGSQPDLERAFGAG